MSWLWGSGWSEVCVSSHQSCAPDCPRGPQSNFCGGRALCRPHSLDCGHTEDSEIAPPRPPPRGIQDTANLPVALSTRGFLWLIKAPEMVLEYCLRHLSPPCSCVFLLSSQLLQEEQTGMEEGSQGEVTSLHPAPPYFRDLWQAGDHEPLSLPGNQNIFPPQIFSSLR